MGLGKFGISSPLYCAVQNHSTSRPYFSHTADSAIDFKCQNIIYVDEPNYFRDFSNRTYVDVKFEVISKLREKCVLCIIQANSEESPKYKH